MGKKTGFLEFKRETKGHIPPLKRIQNFRSFHQPLTRDRQMYQGARCMDCGIPFCQSGVMLNGMTSGCPLNNLIPEWNDLIYHQDYQEAVVRLLKTNNFPEFTSRICPAPCEASCTCAIHGDPVTIKENEFAISVYAYETSLMRPQPPSQRLDKKIAIIGSGPAGLSAADELNKRGYFVTVIERDDRVGGLLMYGIPNMKLEKEVILKRVAIMEKEGIVFKTNENITTKEQVAKLHEEYDAIVLACGSRKARDMKVNGRNAKGIYMAMEYLTQTTKSLLDNTPLQIDVKDKNVIVIGGGDTGNDCVGTAIRHHCKSVLQLEIMAELPDLRAADNPWPEWPKTKKMEYGQEESIAVFKKDPRIYQTTVKAFIADAHNNLKQVILVTVKPTLVNGKMEMKEVPNSERIVDAEVALIAAGFVGVEEKIATIFDIKLTNLGIVENQEAYQTSQNNIYVAGDMRRGQSLVVWAIREGREVAKRVHQNMTEI
jgi:glutamate synthase (NADH) small subunit (EC 1.4.1.14)